MSSPRCHPERRKYSGGIFSEPNPTQGRARSGISARSEFIIADFLLYAHSDLVKINFIVYFFVYSWYAPRIDEEARQGFPLDPLPSAFLRCARWGLRSKSNARTSLKDDPRCVLLHRRMNGFNCVPSKALFFCLSHHGKAVSG